MLAAGWYEGEGSCANTGYLRRGVRAEATQNDTWMLEKLQVWFGGSVTPHINGRAFRWRAYSARARHALLAFYPHLSPRRQAQIRKVLGLEQDPTS